MFSFADNLKKKAKARRSARPTTPPSPGSFFTSPRSPRWATRSTSSDASSNYPIPPVPSIPPPLPDVITISAPPMPNRAPPVIPDSRRPSTSNSSTTEPNPRLDLSFHPSASTSSLTDWFPGGMAPASTTPPKSTLHGHRKAPSVAVRSNSQAPSDVLSPNSLFSPSSTVVSSPSTTVVGSYPNANGSVLGKEPRRFNSSLALNASDPILPTFSTDSKSPSPSRRVGAVPAPIRIPDGSLHHPAVQVDRDRSPSFNGSSTATPSKPVAGPPPPESTPPPSPGTAHDAILASAFMMSADRSNEPVWTGAGLTRMDSATLPRDSYGPGAPASRIRGPRPIRTNSRRQSLAPTLRRSASATAILPGTPPSAASGSTSFAQTQGVSQPSSNGSANTSGSASGMPTVVLQGADGAKRRISAITEISSAGSVYSFPDESAAALRPDPTSKETLQTLPSLTTGASAESLVSDSTEEDEGERTILGMPRNSADDRPILDQVWEFLLPDGSHAGTPRSGGSMSTPSPFPEARISPQSAQGARSTAPTTASNSPSPRMKHQKPTMLRLQDPPKRTSVKRKSVELVQDSTPESPDFNSGPLPNSKGKGKQPVPSSVPHTALAEDMISPTPSTTQHPRGHQRAPSTSTVNTVTGAQSSSHGHSAVSEHSSSSSGAPGMLYLSFKKDPGSVPASLSNAQALFPETPRSFEHSFSPAAVGQTFTVEVTPVHKTRSRVPTLPIGPRTGLSRIHTDNGATSIMREASTGKGSAHSKRPSTAARNPLPPSPKFNTAPIRWKGLTYDAARWTLSSEQLQEIVTRAIKHSAESSSIRLLQPDVVEFDLPTEIETLTRQREELRGRLKQQIRTRRLLLRKLTSPNSTEPLTAQGVARNMGEIMDACAMCDQLSEELFHVSDQLAQIVRLRDVHQASALSMALRKINTSFVRVTSEAVELQKRINTLEAEREEAWHTAESVEGELNEMRAKLAKQSASCKCDHDADAEDEVYSRPSSRVSAARKTSMRASKASLRLSARKSRASSVASSRMFSPDSSDDVPPVPPMPLATSPLQALTDFHNANAKARQSIGATSFVSSIQSPSPESRALAAAQAELLELLGITMNDITGNRSSNGSGTSGRMRRPRSASDAGMHPPPSAGLLLDAPAQFSPQPSPRWTVAAASPMVDAFGRKLRRSVSEYTSKRITAPRPDSMLLSPPRDGSFPTRQSSRGLLEDPDSLLALMTRAASSTESSPLPGHTFTTGRTYI